MLHVSDGLFGGRPPRAVSVCPMCVCRVSDVCLGAGRLSFCKLWARRFPGVAKMLCASSFARESVRFPKRVRKISKWIPWGAKWNHSNSTGILK